MMNLLDFFTKLYAHERNLPGLPVWVMSPARRITRILANKVLPYYLDRENPEQSKVEKGLIVSFTSFPARINQVWQVVECMLRQTKRPEKIVLWLSKEQFSGKEVIPESLRKRENDIFEIRFVDGDIRSHKKYYYALKEFHGSFLFLIDDDIYYPTDIIERTFKAYKEDNVQVVGNYGYVIKYNNAGLAPYRSWSRIVKKVTSRGVFFGSGGGTLINTSALPSESCEIELAMSLTPTADDIWLNAMVQLAGLAITILPGGNILSIMCKNDAKLASANLWSNQNDSQLANVQHYYYTKYKMQLFNQTDTE